MTRSLAILGLLVVGACKDTRTAPTQVEPTPPAMHAIRAPALPVQGPTIENLDRLPAGASARVTSTVLAIVENRTADFVDAVSTGGFTVGALGLTKEQTEAELFGRTVAELTNIDCQTACAWSVSARGAKELQLEAHADNTLVGAVVFVHEDDGTWSVARAMPM